MSKRSTRPPQNGRVSKNAQASLRAQVLTSRLPEIINHLRIIQSAVVVAGLALKQQNCELDADVASVIRHSVIDRLQDEIERLESLGGISPDDEPPPGSAERA